jgi:hypothetical protein
MRALLLISVAFLLFTAGCDRRPAAEPSWISIPPRGPTDYTVFTGGLHITNYSDDKPVVWVFSPYAPLRERVKGVSRFDTQSNIEGSETMCLVVIRRRDGTYTEQTVTNAPVDLRRYIDKMRRPVSELVADLDKCLK